MIFVIQRVTDAKVTIEETVRGEIGKGYMVLIGVADTDTKEIADKMVAKMCKLRIFEDENGKTNLSLADVSGSLLLISQFTLYADCKKGNRPSFSVLPGRAARRIRRRHEGEPDQRRPLHHRAQFTKFIDIIKSINVLMDLFYGNI